MDTLRRKDKFGTIRRQKAIAREMEEFKRDDNMHEQMTGYRRLRKQHQKQLQEVCV
jgi:hypothetical protein